MPCTVKQMLTLSELKGSVVAAGAGGLDKSVSRVNVIDVPDIESWVRGGEFLITTAFFAKDDPQQLSELVRKIESAGAAALGIKLHRFINIIPVEVLSTADDLQFPVIILPTETAFVDIINSVLSQIVNSQAQRLLLSEKIHRAFTQLVIDGGNTQEIIDTLGRTARKSVAYIDLFHEDIIVSDNASVAVKYKDIDLAVIVSKAHEVVTIDNTTYGYVVLLDYELPDHLPDHVRLALEHAVTVLKLDIQKKISNRQIEARYKDMFIQDLIFNNLRSVEEVQKRASFYDWDLDGGMLVVVVDIDNFKVRYLEMSDRQHHESLEATARRVFSIARKVMNLYFPKTFHTTFSDSIVFLVKIGDLSTKEFLDEVKWVGDRVREEVTHTTEYTLTIGIGGYKDSVMDLHNSFSEAKESVKLGRLLYKQDSTLYYDDLGVYRVLAKVYNTPEAVEFCHETLGELEKYDHDHEAEFVKTLEVIVNCDWNLRAAADELYVHYNTVKYRFARICEILGLDMSSPEHKLRVTLALRLRQMVC